MRSQAKVNFMVITLGAMALAVFVMSFFMNATPVAPAEQVIRNGTFDYDKVSATPPALMPASTKVRIVSFFVLAVSGLVLLVNHRGTGKRAKTDALSRENFIARMDHEVRTPLNAIIGMSELARREYGKPEAAEYIEGIQRAGEGLFNVLTDIIDYAKIEAGEIALKNTAYETATLMKEALAAVRTELSEKMVTLTESIPPALPGVLVGDFTRVRQIVACLLSNAAKYTDRGFVKFSVSGKRLEAGKIQLQFTVEDSGVGIRQSDLPRIFGDFAKIDKQRELRFAGAGLGLAIAQRLCRNMEGDLKVKSEFGKGSAFTATLVQKVGRWKPMGKMTMQVVSSVSSRYSFTAPTARVLVVDDLPSSLVVAKGLLSPYKVQLTTCRSGAEAIEVVQKRKFDLLLVDQMMPEMDGVETVKRIRTQIGQGTRLPKDGNAPAIFYDKLPIVAMTANAIAGVREMFLANGFDDYVSKPIEISLLDAVLKKWLPEDKQIPTAELQVDDTVIIDGEIKV
ncbi:hypothetical protein AGMMS49959_15700 [Planctomycetales bacterium]|nr:hypothetical protein AGMMS49959_15700 [Planctomycetales bacterium]